MNWFNSTVSGIRNDDIVYSPAFQSDQGILDLTADESTYDVNSFMVFKDVEYETVEDFIRQFTCILDFNYKIHYNIIKDIKPDGMSSISIEDSTKSKLVIVVPRKISEIDIIRETLFVESVYKGNILNALHPIATLESILLEMENIFK
jgi:hypothetical protein